MAIFDLYSKRQKRSRGEVSDVFIYDEIPQSLRVQIIHIWDDCLGNAYQYLNNSSTFKTYEFIADSLCREYGLFRLHGKDYEDRHHQNELANFLLQERDPEKVLDTIGLSFRVIDRLVRQDRPHKSQLIDDSLIELNARFKEAGVGYQFEEGDIIRVDSQLLHAEAVKPTLKLLNGKEFEGAQDEFLSAYEHYRHGKHKEALNDALKALESTIKSICDGNGWTYSPKDTCKPLLDICYQNNLVPSFWQQHMGGIRSLLEGGVPTGRNKLGGHGQGAEPVSVPSHMVSYVLHMTASAIVFLVNSNDNKA